MSRLHTPYPVWARPCTAQRSSALIIVLFMIVILTFVIVAFTVTSMLDRNSSQSYSQGVSADQLALGGLSQVVTDMQREIAANSTATVISGYTNFTPNFATNAEPEISPAVIATNPGTMNLVKMSSHTAPPYAAGAIEGLYANSAYVNSTANAALNGRFISLTRWNKPAMIANSWPATLSTPDWINVSRSGLSPQTLTVAQAKDASFGNTNFVIGRYAYAVYDEGGMLDATVAGYTTNTAAGMTASIIAHKGNLALADLTQLTNYTSPAVPTQAQVEALVGFRNAYSTNNYASYITNTAPTNGFLYVQGNGTQSDNTFVSRQDLINYATANGLTGVLPYLCTFTREKNQPSWYPTQNASSMTDASGTIHGSSASAYAYTNNMESSTAANRDIPNVRVATAFTRRDGSTAVVGEPLVKRRFPLSQLALLSVASPSSAQLSQIKQYFGLVPDSTSTSASPVWDYDNPNAGSPASSIMTLGQVAALGSSAREPDFFELLKAAILSGSLGLNPGPPIPGGGKAGVYGDVVSITSNSDAQIMQIGADIIDQYRSGNYPIDIYTAIFNSGVNFNTYNHFYGMKNLPYLQRVIQMGTLDPPGSTYNMSTGVGNATGLNVWYVPEFFYPHQSPAVTPGPTKFRMVAFGGESEVEETEHVPTSQALFGQPVDYGTSISSAPALAQITLTPPSPNNYFTMPRYASANSGCSTTSAPQAGSGSTFLLPLNTPQPPPIGCMTAGALPANSLDLPVGIWGGYDTITPAYTYTPNAQPVLLLSFAMQEQDTSGAWHTYSIWKDTGFQQNIGEPATVANAFLQGCLNWARYDSRTNRFGEAESYPSFPNAVGKNAFTPTYYAQVLWTTTPNPASAFTSSPRPDHNQGIGYVSAYPTTANFTYVKSPASSAGFCGGLWADNLVSRSFGSTASVNTYYSDPDGVIRPANGAYSTLNSNASVGSSAGYTDGFPQALITQTTPSPLPPYYNKPTILNRPFRSVAEMGYAYRDLPFKDIDFFTQESADAALLDLFCLDDVDLAAGKINPNTRNGAVLQAMIAGSIKSESAATTIPVADAAAVATKLVAHTSVAAGGTPLVNRSELVTKFSNDLTTALNSQGDVSDYYNKTQRESVVRALADVSNTRTWNLMIDVVAQAGRYPPSATGLNNFVVEGERRYWLHVAIDRYTGKIIDEQLEPVHE